ncbi:MAG: hypothetical protein L0Y72_11800 [Gemmataceae bacterium]|nr:hypothetical protein [Gemmataceae bacterium]MCI0739719.1 hypothetical protein [Gemmataceae bacterium]
MTEPQTPKQPQPAAFHYQALCGLSLALIFLAQLNQGELPLNVLCVLIGTLCLLSRLKLGPILLLVMIGGVQWWIQFRMFRGPAQRARALEIVDVVLCAGVVGFVAAHYRLQSIWQNMLPLDPRRRSGTPRRRFPWFRKQPPIMAEKRAQEQITPFELAGLVLSLPAWAVAAQILWALLPKQVEFIGLPPRVLQMIVVAWGLAVGFLVMRGVFSLWRFRQADAATAQLILQDALWKETRGEQRRIQRWLAWWKWEKRERGE